MHSKIVNKHLETVDKLERYDMIWSKRSRKIGLRRIPLVLARMIKERLAL